ncbi:hypothetical protein [Stenotrophomonas maltophilia]|uniref:hypothetical protein n=1 Tax=Stenotrophomonas maltophilia TaxID=40324 RepID=UPI00117DFC11|nr:hypothetical protein [Stenotrophomonas maltophilia]MCF3536714.1 hypothetical protein [Stenotrophomonas maltophilia]
MVDLVDTNDALGAIDIGEAYLTFLGTGFEKISSLIFQPCADLTTSDDGIHAVDRESLALKATAFLKLARFRNIDFATAPEYLFPWQTLVEAAKNGIHPRQGALWSICFESIKPDELSGVIEVLKDNKITVIEPVLAASGGSFINLLCHFFWARDSNGNFIPIAIFQAKTAPMGGIDFERDGLICGTVIYRFGKADENRLICLICSDSLNPKFHPDVVEKVKQNTIIAHLQLNPDPAAAGFRSYRDHFNCSAPRTVEILSLNWAKGTAIAKGDSRIPLILQPKSIYYRTLEGINESDTTITSNDQKGCYLTNFHRYRTAAYVFHPHENVFELKISKPLMIGAAAVARPTGIAVVARYEWDSNEWVSCTQHADNSFESYLAGKPATDIHLTPYKSQPMDVERVIQLSTGNILTDEAFHWKGMLSFHLEDDDTPSRVQLCWFDDGLGGQNRHECLRRFNSLVAIVDNPTKLPARLASFRSLKPSLTYNPSPQVRRYRNLVVGDNRATVVNLGSSPPTSVLEKTKDNLSKRLFDCGEDILLLSILYRNDAGDVEDYMDTTPPLISQDPDCDPTSITAG